MEKSFGIMYFGIFLVIFTIIILLIINSYFQILANYNPRSGSKLADIVILAIIAFLSIWESTRRYEISLNNELLSLKGDIGSVKDQFDKIV